MKPKRKPYGGVSFTAKDARVFHDVFEVLQDIYGDEARNYMRGYAQIWIRYRQLKDKGVNVRISTPKFGRRQPFLIISK